MFRIGHFQAQLLELQCLLQRVWTLCIFVQIYLSAARWIVMYYTVPGLNLHTFLLLLFTEVPNCQSSFGRAGSFYQNNHESKF